jgi:hypothetical protein
MRNRWCGEVAVNAMNSLSEGEEEDVTKRKKDKNSRFQARR